MLACPALAKRLISIHALRKESDSINAPNQSGACYFNPRSP